MLRLLVKHWRTLLVRGLWYTLYCVALFAALWGVTIWLVLSVPALRVLCAGLLFTWLLCGVAQRFTR